MQFVAAVQEAPSIAKAALEARLACRHGEITGHTAGLAPGFVQGNLCIVDILIPPVGDSPF